MTAQLSSLCDVISRWERERPETEAIRLGDAAWTWGELADRVRRLAGALRAAGVQPGERVASLDKNHPACLELTLACALTGAANAVVNFRLAPEEIVYVIEDSQARVLVIGAEFVPLLDQIRARLSTVRQVVVAGGDADEYEAWLGGAQPISDPYPAAPGDSFLQLYTSGTTGFPKGAMLTHRGMLAHAAAVQQDSDLSAESVSMVAMPLFHVGGSSWALVALSAGARVVMLREPIPQVILDELVRQRVTHTFFVPALLGFLLQVPDVAERDYSALQEISFGASPMPLPLLRRCLQTFPTNFFQVYGMTEACGVVTSLGPEEHRDPAHEHRLTSAGKPIPGVEITVVEPGTSTPLPAGAPGEVLVRTEQLMAGYWGKPEATAAALTEDGWLRSGDVGHLDEDGYLYISDRIKDLVISGGENVYPAEVERVLVEHPAIAEVAVIGVPDETWGEVPKAVVVAADGATVDEPEVISSCREHLAAFKCPKSVAVVDELPRNLTGKVLKKDLRAQYAT